MQAALDLSSKIKITITGQKSQAITNEVFLANAVMEALPKLSGDVLTIIARAVKRETLSRSDIIKNQTSI